MEFNDLCKAQQKANKNKNVFDWRSIQIGNRNDFRHLSTPFVTSKCIVKILNLS